MKTSINNNKPVGIFSYTGVDNYGSCLQNYALSRQVEKLGYQCKQIFLFGNRNRHSPFYSFRKRYFHLTEPIFSFTQCLELNDCFDTIITGSDCIWQERFVQLEKSMLAWASGNKTLFSYAASFGEGCLHSDTDDGLVKSMLSRLDAISVREESGVEICTSLGLKAKCVLDPTLLLQTEEYDALLGDFVGDLTVPDNFIFLYDVGRYSSEQISALTAEFAARGQTLITKSCYGRSVLTPEQWINLIKNSKYVITNSFHGICFSIIFKKQFIHLSHSINRTRYSNLYKQLGINKDIYELSELTPNTILKENQLDYNEIYSKLNSLRDDSVNFLSHALLIPPSYKPPFINSVLAKDGLLVGGNDPDIPRLDIGRLDSWADEHPVDVSMTTQHRDMLKSILDLKIESLFYTYETKDPNVLADREMCRGLLLAQARRLFYGDQLEEIEKKSDFLYKPHKLKVFLDKTIYTRHKEQFIEKVRKLGKQKVYYIFLEHAGYTIYSYAKDALTELDVKAYITFSSPPPSFESIADKSVPRVELLPFILSTPPLPVIAFGSKTYYTIALLESLGYAGEVIPCAYG